MDETTFKLSGKINRLNCMYWANENPNIAEEKTVNLPGVAVWCDLSSRGLIRLYIFEETVTGQTYLQMLELMIPRLNDIFENENEVYLQQDGAPPHFHVNVRNFLDRKFNQMIPRLNDLFENENEVYFQQDGAPPHFHVNVRNFLDRTFNQMIPRLNDLFENENEVYFLQDGAPPHFHVNVRNFLDGTFNQKWIGRTGSATEFLLDLPM